MAGTITSLEEDRRGRTAVYLDGALVLRLPALVAASAGLCLGRFLTDKEIASLQGQGDFQSTMDLALRYLSFRARSEKEVRDYLCRHQVPEETATAVLSRLRELRLVDDVAFAMAWIEERRRLRPRGARALSQELRRKGVASETIEAVLPADDPEEAYRLARRRAQHLDRSDRQAFRRRLSAYLLRRGYSYDLVGTLVDRLWTED